MCGIDRFAGMRGYCRAGNKVKVYRSGAHFGEEPPISGNHGSGTIFFTYCPLSCLSCQNYPWSSGGEGDEIETEDLEEILKQLASYKCHNWNFVTPTPWLPFIDKAVRRVRSEGISLPTVYNTSGYERVDIVKKYRNLMDIVLTDLRYSTPEAAAEGSSARNYVQFARDFIKWSYEEIGPLETDENAVAKSGVIVRLLVLPGRSGEAVDSLSWLADNVGTDIAVSLMSQYTPVHKALETSSWDRAILKHEFEEVASHMDDLGFESGWVQQFTSYEADNDLLGCNMEKGKR